jgi:hypothetical protein
MSNKDRLPAPGLVKIYFKHYLQIYLDMYLKIFRLMI